MITPLNGPGAGAPIHASVCAPIASGEGARVREAEQKFDRVNLSGDNGGVSGFQRELVSRLVQEVRSTHTTSSIQRLREEISGGTYQVDPSGIAGRLLLEGIVDGNK